MPNWCKNILQINGPSEDLMRFKVAAVGYSPWSEPEADEPPSVFNFHSLMPVPETVLCAGYSSAGYDWELENRGCKWSARSPWIESEHEHEIVYFFETAWSPPLQLLRHLSGKWPKLKFGISFMDEIGNFEGEASIELGKFEYRIVEPAEFREKG